MNENEIKILSEEIKLQRFKQKKTQEECANAMDISILTYRNFENNPNKMDIDQTIKLSSFLQYNIFDFFLHSILQNAIKNYDDSCKNRQNNHKF